MTSLQVMIYDTNTGILNHTHFNFYHVGKQYSSSVINCVGSFLTNIRHARGCIIKHS